MFLTRYLLKFVPRRTFPAILLALSSLINLPSFSQECDKSIINKAMLQKDDTAKVQTLIKIAYRCISNNNSAADSLIEAIKIISKKINYFNGESEARILIMKSLFNQGNYSAAMNIAEENKIYFTEKNVLPEIAECYSFISMIHEIQGRYQDAINANLQATDYYLQLKDSMGLAGAYDNLGIIYSHLDNFPKTIEWFEKALKIREAMDNKRQMASSYNNIGIVYENMNDYEKAAEYHKKSLEIRILLGDKSDISTSYNNIGLVYESLQDYEKAFEYHNKALVLRTEINDNLGIISCQRNIGSVYFNQKKYTQAISALLKSIELAKKISVPEAIMQGNEILAKTYAATGNYPLAFKAHREFISIKDSLMNVKNTEYIAEMETRFESEKKLREIELLNKERLIRQTEIERKTSEAKHFQFQRNTIIAGMLFALALVIVVFKSYNDKKKANDVLHYQKEQIEEKNKELFAANAETELQKKVLEEKNKDILDSIRYAKRIQQAILPSSQKISDLLPQSFVLYKPKDIISGDFYWIYCNSVGNAQSSNTGEKIFLAAADCTGHGVPGAMVSLMGYNGLNKAVIEQKINQPSKILDSLSHSVIQGFRQEGKAEIKDGMDLALVSISRNPDSKLPNEEEMGYLLSFSGANNPIYIIRKKGLKGLRINNKQALHSAENNDFVLYEIPGNRQAIGASEAHEPFTNNEIIVRNTDCIYLFTDGYIDQFGGEKGKKFKSSNFKKLLLSVCNEPIDKQKNTISDTIEQWKGHYEQVDDMCVIGIRV